LDQTPRIPESAVIYEPMLHGTLIHFGPMSWKRWLAYVTGSRDEELFRINEYLVTGKPMKRVIGRPWPQGVSGTPPDGEQLQRAPRRHYAGH